MAFTDYKTTEAALTKFEIIYQEMDFIEPTPFDISSYFLQEFEFGRTHIPTTGSEAAIREVIIFPILKELVKHYKDDFVLWSHRTITYADGLSGQPDYLLATQSKLGRVVLGYPLLLAVEAKQNDFERGWGQCLAELVALQKLNNAPDFAVYGIVTDGEVWQMGRLVQQQFTKNRAYWLNDLPQLLGALNALLATLKQQVISQQ